MNAYTKITENINIYSKEVTSHEKWYSLTDAIDEAKGKKEITKEKHKSLQFMWVIGFTFGSIF